MRPKAEDFLTLDELKAEEQRLAVKINEGTITVPEANRLAVVRAAIRRINEVASR